MFQNYTKSYRQTHRKDRKEYRRRERKNKERKEPRKKGKVVIYGSAIYKRGKNFCLLLFVIKQYNGLHM